MECEELGCVAGGPFKPNKLREVRGLVWRPWINKPFEMTMRAADICHHTYPASKHKPSLPPSPLHTLCPICSLSPLPLYTPLLLHLSHVYLLHSSVRIRFFVSQHLHLPLCFIWYCHPALPSPSPYLHSSISSLPGDSIHPAVHPCMACCQSGVLYVL